MVPRGPEYDYVEKPSMALLEELGWTPVDAFHETLGAQGTIGRDSQHDVVLTQVTLAGEQADSADVLTYRDGELVKFQTAGDTALLERVFGST